VVVEELVCQGDEEESDGEDGLTDAGERYPVHDCHGGGC
jgi:hypothetical protein